MSGVVVRDPTVRVQRPVPRHPTGADEQHVAGFDGDALRFERRRQIVRLDGVGDVRLNRPPLRLTPPRNVREYAAPGDAALGPVVDPVVLVGDAVVEVVHRMLDVTEAVPLRRRLRVPTVQVLVVTGFVLQPYHLVLVRLASEHRRIGKMHVEVDREHRTLAHATRSTGYAVGR